MSVRVTVEMPCCVREGSSRLGLVWPRASVYEMARIMNRGGVLGTGMTAEAAFKTMGLSVRPIRGTARVDASREARTGYLFVVYDADVPDEGEITRMAELGVQMAKAEGRIR